MVNVVAALKLARDVRGAQTTATQDLSHLGRPLFELGSQPTSLVQLSSAIGAAKLLSLFVETEATALVADGVLRKKDFHRRERYRRHRCGHYTFPSDPVVCTKVAMCVWCLDEGSAEHWCDNSCPERGADGNMSDVTYHIGEFMVWRATTLDDVPILMKKRLVTAMDIWEVRAPLLPVGRRCTDFDGVQQGCEVVPGDVCFCDWPIDVNSYIGCMCEGRRSRPLPPSAPVAKFSLTEARMNMFANEVEGILLQPHEIDILVTSEMDPGDTEIHGFDVLRDVGASASYVLGETNTGLDESNEQNRFVRQQLDCMSLFEVLIMSQGSFSPLAAAVQQPGGVAIQMLSQKSRNDLHNVSQ